MMKLTNHIEKHYLIRNSVLYNNTNIQFLTSIMTIYLSNHIVKIVNKQSKPVLVKIKDNNQNFLEEWLASDEIKSYK